MELSTGIALCGFFIGLGVALGLSGGIYYATPKSNTVEKRMKTLDISHLAISSLKDYFTNEYKGDISEIKALDCSYNGLTSLEGCPPNLERLWCVGNKLQSLHGCPSTLVWMDCSSNELMDLSGCPENVQFLYCARNQLQSLQGCPPKLKGLWCGFNGITDFSGLSEDTLLLYCKPNPGAKIE